MTDNDIYTRQHDLNLDVPDTVTVIGVGGVGSWVALDLALAGARKIFLVDHDHIERHNLNRTPFTEAQVDMDKTQAVAELITERRMDTETIPITGRIEEQTGSFKEEIADNPVIDCRDHASELPDGIEEQVVLTAGYDGFEFTIHTNPDYGSVWGDEETEYDTVPSFVAPAQFLASAITTIACSPQLRDGEEQYSTGDMRNLLTRILDEGDE